MQGEIVARFGPAFSDLEKIIANFRLLLMRIPCSVWDKSEEVIASKSAIKDFCGKFGIGVAIHLSVNEGGPCVFAAFYPLKADKPRDAKCDRWSAMLQNLNAKYAN